MNWADLLKSIVCVLNLIHGIRRGSDPPAGPNPESRHLDVSARSLAWQEPVASSLCDINKGLCG